MITVPKVYTSSQLQRKYAKILDEIEASNQPAFLSRHGKTSFVILKIKENQTKINEEEFWQELQNNNLNNLWDKSDDIYEKMV